MKRKRIRFGRRIFREGMMKLFGKTREEILAAMQDEFDVVVIGAGSLVRESCGKRHDKG